MEQSLKLAGRLRANHAAMARTLRDVPIEEAEVGSVLARTPERIAEWMDANSERQISARHFWQLAERANAVSFTF